MLSFQTVRTARFTFTLKELSVGDIRRLYNISPNYIEKQRTFFLNSALDSLIWHQGFESNTLDDLTVQERLFIEACYLSTVSDVADFSISNGKYTDYLLVEKQFQRKDLELGSIQNDDDVWFMKHLTGIELELIEERVLSKANYERIDWVLYAMAAAIYRETETLPNLKQDPIAYGDWLDERVEKLNGLPETAAINLITLFFTGLEKLTHLFAINFGDEGVCITSEKTTQNKKGEEVAVLPARFLPCANISTVTQKLLGKFEQNG